MFGRRKERARLQRWADVLIAAARDAHYDATIEFDVERVVVSFDGRDEIDLGALLAEHGHLTEPQLRAKIEARARWVAKRQFVVPDDWQTGDRELAVSIRSSLFRAQGPYGGSVAEELARIARLIGRADWEELLDRAGDLHASDARSNDVLSDRILVAAAIRAELGQPDRARQLAEEYRAMSGDVDAIEDIARNASALEREVLATLWIGGRSAVADLAPRVESAQSERVDILTSAAVAAQAGDESAFDVELDRARRWLARDQRAGYRYSTNGPLPMELMIDVLEQWSPTPGAGSPVVATRSHEVEVIGDVPAPDADRVRWHGDVAVASSDAGAVGVDLSGVVVSDAAVLSDEAEPAPVDVCVEDGRVVVRIAGGQPIVLEADDEEGLGLHDAVVLADRVVVYGEFGPFLVFDRNGREQHRLLGHENDPNLGASGRGDRLVTWAADGRVVVWELPRGVVFQAFDIGEWPYDAELDESGEYLAIRHPGAGWTLWAVRSGEQLVERGAAEVAWHATEPAIAMLRGGALQLLRIA